MIVQAKMKTAETRNDGHSDIERFAMSAAGCADTTNTIIEEIKKTILTEHPDTQAIYLFGSWGTKYQTATSDMDMAVLLPREKASQIDGVEWFNLTCKIAKIARLDAVDLINLRRVESIELKIEAIDDDRKIYCDDEIETKKFEAETQREYKKLTPNRMNAVFVNRQLKRKHGLGPRHPVVTPA